MKLYHFSEEPDITSFVPRAVRQPSPRGEGGEWLNGPLVWAVTGERQAAYLFPRDCPRILLWLTPHTTSADRDRWWGSRTCRMIANVEWAWLPRLSGGVVYRYELPVETFEAVDGDWQWVSRETVRPTNVERLDDLLGELEREQVELRVMHRLAALRGVWDTTLHASGIRLRNAREWPG